LLDHSILLADPGSVTYTREVFSNKRYDNNILNSYGHSTPLPADTKQSNGRPAYAKVTHLKFTDDIDTITFDLRSAYDVPELTRLDRTFVYNRSNEGTLTVVDEVSYTSPKPFEVALITLDAFEQIDADTLKITNGEEAILVSIDTAGEPIEIHSEQIQEEVHTKTLPTRLGIRLRDKIISAKVKMTFTPATSPKQP
jgi:hypothetical protein